MPPYATQSDLLDILSLAELTQLTDDEKTGQVNQTVLNGVLTRASGVIEGYCRSRYQVPLQPSAEVTAICTDIAVWLLFTRRSQKMRDAVQQRYDGAMALLKAVSTGGVALDQPAGAPTPQASTGGPVQPTCTDLRFTQCNLKGYV